MDNILEIRDLTVELPGFKLDNINLSIPTGSIVGLIGRNGAGKTTLLNTIEDIYTPTGGSILYSGRPMRGNEVEIKSELGVVQSSLFYPAATRAKNVAKYVAAFYPDFDMERWHALMAQFGLDEKKNPAAYSKGMQMRFMFTMILARKPKLLLLDEPTAGLDPAARLDILEMLQTYMEEDGRSILFSTHITEDLEKFADYVALVAKGRLVFMEEKDALMDRFALVQADASALTEELRPYLQGAKTHSYGVTGITAERARFEGKPGIVLTRPRLEDLLIYGDGDEQ